MPGGKVEHGYSFDQNGIKELKEELGAKTHIKYSLKCQMIIQNGKINLQKYIVGILIDELKKPIANSEVDSYEIVTL
jgi:8-oxo-dGTP pyrophosphatase MutT (NUDIX family)